MTDYNIGYFVGSLATNSINRSLSKALIKLAPDNLHFTEIPIKDLPLYSHDFDASYPPEGTALKNAIDWGSRPWGANSFARKPSGIVGASVGAIGTAVMQSNMRSVLSFLDAAAEGHIGDPDPLEKAEK